MPAALNLTGMRFGRLVALSPCIEDNVRKWVCSCDCGNTHVVKTVLLTRGKTKSCGCYKIDLLLERAKIRGEHTSFVDGVFHTDLYDIWFLIKGRTGNPAYKNYKSYGGKGITLFKEWEESFESFLKGVGQRPSKEHSLDRINPHGNYEPGNVRWALSKEQSRNLRMFSTNKTGVTGVYCSTRDGIISYTAVWVDLEGNVKTKTFSGRKYGEDAAFQLAINARRTAIDSLNAQGAGYTEHHGT